MEKEADFRAFAAKYGVLCCAEMIAATALAPLERCKLILQTQNLVKIPSMERYTGFTSYLRNVPRKEGFRRFWKGNVSTLFKFLVSTSIRYPIQPRALPLLSGLNVYGYDLGSLAFQSGFGFTVLMLTYPLDLVRTRLACDVTRKGEQSIYSGLTETLYKTISDEGLFSPFKGVSVALFSLIPYLVLEQVLATVVQKRLKEHSDSLLEDQIKKHSVSMGLTQFLLYPLDTVRRKLQVGGSRCHEETGGIVKCCKFTYEKEGFLGFYRGWMINTLRLAPTLAIFYYLSDFARISY